MILKVLVSLDVLRVCVKIGCVCAYQTAIGGKRTAIRPRKISPHDIVDASVFVVDGVNAVRLIVERTKGFD